MIFASVGAVFGCSCNGDKVKVTFVTESNSDIVRYVKKGKTLTDIPQPPAVKGKYCLWEDVNFQNIQEDMTVVASCYSTVTNLVTNMPSVIDVEIDSEKADLDYIFKDMELEATFESGEKKVVYPGEYKLETNGYNKGISGTYTVSVVYNNAKKNVRINVNKIKNYVTVSLNSGTGYYSEGLPQLTANTTVPGNVVFDADQSLYVGTKAYAWTFTPIDTNKYNVEKGYINVSLIKASSISANKSSLKVAFGSSRKTIISLIKEDLVVQAAYGTYYREIDERYYSIDSSDFVLDRSGVFNFRISYDSSVYVDIQVTVEKCKEYPLDVDFSLAGSNYVYEDGDTFDDIIQYITYSAKTLQNTTLDGTLTLESGQTLTAGTHTYTLIFTPNNTDYAQQMIDMEITV